MYLKQVSNFSKLALILYWIKKSFQDQLRTADAGILSAYQILMADVLANICIFTHTDRERERDMEISLVSHFWQSDVWNSLFTTGHMLQI